MAKRKTTARSSKSSKKKNSINVQEIFLQATKPAVLGIGLFLLSLFTWLSLITQSPGFITGAWVEWLRTMFGVGMWGFPLVTGALSLWLIIHAIERMQDIAWQRPVGAALIFVAYITGATLLLPQGARITAVSQGSAGGWVGLQLAEILQNMLSLGGAWALTTFVAIAGILLVAEELLAQAGNWFWTQIQLIRVQATLAQQVRSQEATHEPLIHGPGMRAQPVSPVHTPKSFIPLPTGIIPWWKVPVVRDVMRWWRLRTGGPVVRYTGQRPHDYVPPEVQPSQVTGEPPNRANGYQNSYQNAYQNPYSAPVPTPAYAYQSSTNGQQPTAQVSGHPQQPFAAQTAPEQGTSEQSSADQVASGPIDGQAVQQPLDNDLLNPRIVGQATEWRLPLLDATLRDWERNAENFESIREQGRLIVDTLAQFGVPVSFEEASIGPTVTQYLVKPGYTERTVKGEVKRAKVKVSKISSLASDLALALAAPNVRIEAPIPGTRYVGVEVPNITKNTVGLKDLMDSEGFQNRKGNLLIALGEDVKGQPIVTDLTKMPHLLIAGATGAGKSVCINSIIAALLCTHTPDSLRFLMVDPKMVELSVYNGTPHLLSPVVTEVDKAAGVLFWAVKEMERRYSLCSKVNARDLIRYNEYLEKSGEKKLPYIVVIVDEMADLMMAAPEEVEQHICRLAQKSRAIGIHLIIATQRPSVDVITGLIKANFPARISFAVTSQTDSRVIMDTPGAEKLLGRGDMLFMSPDASKLERLQGTFLDDDEINNVVYYWHEESNRIMRDWKGIRSLEDEVEGVAVPVTEPAASQTATAQPSQVSSQSAQPRQPSAMPTSPHQHTSSSPASHPSPLQALSQQVAAQPALSLQNNSQANTAIQQNAMSSGAQSNGAQSNGAQSNGAQSNGSLPSPFNQGALFQEIDKMRALDARDDLFEVAAQVVREAQRGSVSLLQRKLRIGYNRASRLVDQLEVAGILGPDRGSSMGREVLLDAQGRKITPTPAPSGVAAGMPAEMATGIPTEEPQPAMPRLKPRIIGDDELSSGSVNKPAVWM
ncbi:MAG: DNA translocase FtsK [Chloroflexota bacterium]